MILDLQGRPEQDSTSSNNSEKEGLMESIAGIDISKGTFDALTLLSAKEKHRQFSNKKEGWTQFWTNLQKLGADKLYVCMEATGLYWEGLAQFLHEKGVTVFVVNARRIKGFAMSEDKRTKTDKVDAGVIARFCRAHLDELKPWTPPASYTRKLQSLTRQLASLKEDRARQAVRLQSATLCSEVSESIKLHICFLDKSIKSMESSIESLISNNAVLREKEKLARSVKGVGPITASVVLAECRLFNEISHRRQVAAFAGLDVTQFSSGTSIRSKPRLSKRGNARIRQVLYMAAMAAKRSNPVIKSLYERLLANGKTKMQALGACMRKLLELIFAVVTSERKFDPVYRAAQSQGQKPVTA